MHPHDDVAHNIRSQQQADAMPSAEEAKAEHRNYLRREGCADCEESDPDALDVRFINFPSCRAYQEPRDPTVVLCDDCHEARPTLRERAIEKAIEINERYDDPDRPDPKRGNKNDGKIIAIVFYGCETWEFAHQPLIDDGTGDKYPHPHAQAVAPIECRCGSVISEVGKLSDLKRELQGGDDDDN